MYGNKKGLFAMYGDKKGHFAMYGNKKGHFAMYGVAIVTVDNLAKGESYPTSELFTWILCSPNFVVS